MTETLNRPIQTPPTHTLRIPTVVLVPRGKMTAEVLPAQPTVDPNPPLRWWVGFAVLTIGVAAGVIVAVFLT